MCYAGCRGDRRVAGGIRFQTRYKLPFRSVSNSTMVCPSTPGAPLLALTRRYASHTSCFEILNDFPCDTSLPTRFLPGALVDQTNKPRMVRPLRSTPITGASSLLRTGPPARPASVLNTSQFLLLGALPLTTHNLRAEVSGHAFPRSMQQPQTRLASPPCRTPSGQ